MPAPINMFVLPLTVLFVMLSVALSAKMPPPSPEFVKQLETVTPSRLSAPPAST
jgi:hypothetical protein